MLEKTRIIGAAVFVAALCTVNCGGEESAPDEADRSSNSKEPGYETTGWLLKAEREIQEKWSEAYWACFFKKEEETGVYRVARVDVWREYGKFDKNWQYNDASAVRAERLDQCAEHDGKNSGWCEESTCEDKYTLSAPICSAFGWRSDPSYSELDKTSTELFELDDFDAEQHLLLAARLRQYCPKGSTCNENRCAPLTAEQRALCKKSDLTCSKLSITDCGKRIECAWSTEQKRCLKDARACDSDTK